MLAVRSPEKVWFPQQLTCPVANLTCSKNTWIWAFSTVTVWRNVSHRHAEDTVAALQLPGGCRWLLAEAQLAEHLRPRFRVSAGLRGPRCRIPGFLAHGGTPAGHVGARHAGREGGRNQAASSPSAGDREELQPPCSWKQKQNSSGCRCHSFLPLCYSWHNHCQAFTAPCVWKPVVCSGNWYTSCDDFTSPWSNTLSLPCYLGDELVIVENCLVKSMVQEVSYNNVQLYKYDRFLIMSVISP